PPYIFTHSLHDALPISSSNSLKCSLMTLTQWLRKLGLNDLGNLFNVAASLTRLRKQSASVATLASKANTAFLNGSNTNAKIRIRSEEHTSDLQSLAYLV